MDPYQRVLKIHLDSSFYRMDRYKVGDFFGPVDLGLHLAGKNNSLNIGVGLLAGSIFPGSSRLMFTGFSPCWGGFYISSMGGAGLVFDNLGCCRFHRMWVEEMMPEIIDSIYGMKEQYLKRIEMTASRINSRNASVYWESERCIDYVHAFLKRKRDVEKKDDPELFAWLDRFEKDRKEAALSFWYEIHKGIRNHSGSSSRRRGC